MRLFRGHPLNPLRLLLLVVAPLVLLRLVAAETFADPFLSADDLEALLGDPSGALAETRANGRWLSYLWASWLPRIGLDAAVMLFFGLWSLTAALIAVAIFREDETPARALLVSVAVAVAPPANAMTADLAGMVPLMALLAAYAAVVLVLPLRTAHLLAMVFVPAGIMVHGIAPILMLVILVSAARKIGDVQQMTETLAVFLLATALGVGMVFALNAAIHDTVGLVRASGSAEGIAERLGLVEVWLVEVALGLFGEFWPVCLAGLALFLASLFATNSRRGHRLFGAFGVVLIVLSLRTVLSGSSPGFVEALPLWILSISTLAWAGREIGTGAVGAPALLGVAGFALVGAMTWEATCRSRAPYQATTRAIAAEILSLAPDGSTLVVAGSPAAVPGAWVLADFDGLALRLALLTGRRTVQCPSEAALCQQHAQQILAMPPRPSDGWIAPAGGRDGGHAVLLLRLPDGVFRPGD